MTACLSDLSMTKLCLRLLSQFNVRAINGFTFGLLCFDVVLSASIIQNTHSWQCYLFVINLLIRNCYFAFVEQYSPHCALWTDTSLSSNDLQQHQESEAGWWSFVSGVEVQNFQSTQSQSTACLLNCNSRANTMNV